MPLPIPSPNVPAPVQPRPYYVRDTQSWVVEQERQRHDEALYYVGEYSVIVLMWHTVDFETGLVGRCKTCFSTGNNVNDRIAAVYKQPTTNRCPDCYGTTYEGGFRARIVRPVIFADTDETERQDRRGSVHPDSVSAETTWDFRAYQGDYVFRSDGTRWRVTNQPQRTTVRTGFGHPSQAAASLGYTRMSLGYEEPTTVAYTIAPLNNSIAAVLNVGGHSPVSFAGTEKINGPLVTGEGLGD